MPSTCCLSFFFFFNDTATTEIYTLSLHDALPISRFGRGHDETALPQADGGQEVQHAGGQALRLGLELEALVRVDGDQLGERADRKSTRLNSSHLVISYAVFCLKKKKKQHNM